MVGSFGPSLTQGMPILNFLWVCVEISFIILFNFIHVVGRVFTLLYFMLLIYLILYPDWEIVFVFYTGSLIFLLFILTFKITRVFVEILEI